MAPSRTKTIKNKHAANGSGIRGSIKSKNGPQSDGVLKSKKNPNPRVQTTNVKGRPKIAELLKKKKQRVYSAKELGIQDLNMVTPIGVVKPKGKKKGKVFVDDRESMTTILAIVEAQKNGQIESKMIKARQMEEIREARRLEAEAKDAERKEKFDETKDSMRNKRKRYVKPEESDHVDVKDFVASGTNAVMAKKKRVSFA
ncbi:60S ribosomal subunit assembly export protein loc-1 [Cercophora scortea]|uniref:60S ribosomal subunit assembly export protein loc-1 n=1 Tax=Cercophora scortea TaxID=314031 RepID=A0AAE0MCV4_9PEZI|nr:60S ribosomal subunit assembly export protein loc-1 [Cercophora scortea]